MAKRKTSDGIEYEKLAESIFKKLNFSNPNSKVERDVKLDSEYGERQFDVVVTDVTSEFSISTIIESKDYKNPVSIGIVESFISKLSDFNAKRSFIIARSGFTKNALKKATDNNIICCTAQEALHPKWNIDSFIPVHLVEVTPLHVKVNYANLQVKPKESFIPLTVNGINIPDLFKKKWSEGAIEATNQATIETLRFKEIKPPYYVNFKAPNGTSENREVTALQIHVVWQWKYYISSLDQVKRTQTLKDYQSDSMNIFLDIHEIDQYSSFMQETTEAMIRNDGVLTLHIYVRPGIDFGKYSLENFSFEETH